MSGYGFNVWNELKLKWNIQAITCSFALSFSLCPVCKQYSEQYWVQLARTRQHLFHESNPKSWYDGEISAIYLFPTQIQ